MVPSGQLGLSGSQFLRISKSGQASPRIGHWPFLISSLVLGNKRKWVRIQLVFNNFKVPTTIFVLPLGKEQGQLVFTDRFNVVARIHNGQVVGNHIMGKVVTDIAGNVGIGALFNRLLIKVLTSTAQNRNPVNSPLLVNWVSNQAKAGNPKQPLAKLSKLARRQRTIEGPDPPHADWGP